MKWFPNPHFELVYTYKYAQSYWVIIKPRSLDKQGSCNQRTSLFAMDQSRLSQIFREDMMRGMTRLQELKYQAVVILKPQDGPMEVMGDDHLCDYVNSLSDLPFTDAVPRGESRIPNQPIITLTKPPYFERKKIEDKRRFLRQLVSSIISPQWKQEIAPDFWPSGFPYHDPSKGYTKDEIPVIVDHIYNYFNANSTNGDLDSSSSNGVESDRSDENSNRDEASSPLSINNLPSRRKRRVVSPPSSSDSDISNDDRGSSKRRRVQSQQSAVGPIPRTPDTMHPAPGPSTSDPSDAQCSRDQENKKSRTHSLLQERTKKHVTFHLQSQNISNDDRGSVPSQQNAVGPIPRTPDPMHPTPGPSNSDPPDQILSRFQERTKKHVTFLLQSQNKSKKSSNK